MWADVSRRHIEAEDSQGALNELFDRYAELDAANRDEVNRVLFGVLEAGTESERYDDALAIINRFQIVEALEGLKSLASRLQTIDAPGAPFELTKVQRFIVRLTESSKRQ